MEQNYDIVSQEGGNNGEQQVDFVSFDNTTEEIELFLHQDFEVESEVAFELGLEEAQDQEFNAEIVTQNEAFAAGFEENISVFQGALPVGEVRSGIATVMAGPPAGTVPGWSQVRVIGDANLVAENIKDNVSILGVRGTYGPNTKVLRRTITDPGTHTWLANNEPADSNGRLYDGYSKVQITASVENKGIVIPSTSDRTFEPAGSNIGIGSITVKGEPNLQPQNILSGKTIFGVVGNAGVDVFAKTIEPNFYGIGSGSPLTFRAYDEKIGGTDKTYDGYSEVIINRPADLRSDYILKNKKIFGITGSAGGSTLNRTIKLDFVDDNGNMYDSKTFKASEEGRDSDGAAYIGYDQITIERDPFLTPDYISKEATIYGVTGGLDVEPKFIEDKRLSSSVLQFSSSGVYSNSIPASNYKEENGTAFLDGFSSIQIGKDPELTPGNIRAGKNIYGITGNVVEAKHESLTRKDLDFSKENFVLISPSGDNNGLSSVTILKDDNLIPGNIIEGVTIFGIKGEGQSDRVPEELQLSANILKKSKHYIIPPANKAFSQVILKGDPNFDMGLYADGHYLFGQRGTYISPMLENVEIEPTDIETTYYPDNIEGVSETYYGFKSVTVKPRTSFEGYDYLENEDF